LVFSPVGDQIVFRAILSNCCLSRGGNRRDAKKKFYCYSLLL